MKIKIDFVGQFKVLFLKRAIKFLGIFEASSGGVTGTVADPKLSVIIIHLEILNQIRLMKTWMTE